MSEHCSQITAKGTRCKNSPMTGADRCVAHMPSARRYRTSFTPEAQDRIVQFLRTGSYIEVAAAAAGISRSRYYGWMERGRLDRDDPKDAAYRAFRKRVEQALAEGEARSVAMIATAASTNWQAAAWLLERRHPERWARLSQREPEQPTAADVDPTDPFAEVDELATRRRKRE